MNELGPLRREVPVRRAPATRYNRGLGQFFIYRREVDWEGLGITLYAGAFCLTGGHALASWLFSL